MWSVSRTAARLKEMAEQAFKHGDPEITLTVEAHASFRSLLGGVGWLTQTRPDVMVYVSALQRVMSEPKAKHVIALNKVLRYIKRKPLTVN